MKLKVIHHLAENKQAAWTEVVDAKTGEAVESIKHVSIEYHGRCMRATITMCELEVQTAAPTRKPQGPDL